MRTHHAALIGIGPRGVDAANVLALPYAPETFVRTFERGPAGTAETIAVTFVLDATDSLAAGDPATTRYGLQPSLARLHVLVTSEFLLLGWNDVRAIPIQPVSVSVTELAFDAALNPVRAEVTLRALVVTSASVPGISQYVEQAHAEIGRLAAMYKSPVQIG